MSEKKHRRRFGDRSDGRRLRSLDPMNMVSSFIMAKRNDAFNLVTIPVEVSEVDNYIRKKRSLGRNGFGILHVILAAYVRTVAQRPGVNRFVSGQHVFARNDIEVMLTVKKEMTLDAQETVVKCYLEPTDSPDEVYSKMEALVTENREMGDQSDFDSTARVLRYIPGIILKFTVWLLNLLDYFGLLPKFLLRVSPFHGSFFITSMGSLGIPSIYHHLYNFGNVPVFCSYGAKRYENVISDDGTVVKKKYIDLKFTLDERICDGHYYASAIKKLNFYMKNPEKLEIPVEVVSDID